MTSGLDSSAKPSVPNLYFTKVRLRTFPHEIGTVLMQEIQFLKHEIQLMMQVFFLATPDWTIFYHFTWLMIQTKTCKVDL